jgi:hypothetical protein
MDRRTLFVDVDETLLLHDKSQFDSCEHVEVECNGRTFVGVPHWKNILLLEKFWRLGYDVYVWSKTGESWARAVVKKLELEPFVRACLSKPDYYMDDKGCETWCGPRVYRDPKTGTEA